ncbi:MAG: PhoH family protein [Leptospira sp.]|nr:PhoH family protein [Leptospira sp.]
MGESQNFSFANQELYQNVCGIGDNRLRDVEKQLKIKIIPRGISLIFQGDDERVDLAHGFFSELQTVLLSRPDVAYFDQEDLNTEIQKLFPKYMNPTVKPPSDSVEWTPTNRVFTSFKGKPIFPRTENQEKFTDSLKNNYISFALGPAGTGKTFLSIAVACRLMQTGEVDRLVLTRPAVEAGESLGFLPGDLVQKVNPYLRPIYDALHECIGFEKTTELISVGKIEIAPIAFMRGRTLSNSFIILDEAQNCTLPQLKMFLTRFGKNSRMSVSGDITQIDLEHGRSGLEKTVNILNDTKGIGIVQFNDKDITRHPIVSTIVKKFEGRGL